MCFLVVVADKQSAKISWRKLVNVYKLNYDILGGPLTFFDIRKSEGKDPIQSIISQNKIMSNDNNNDSDPKPKKSNINKYTDLECKLGISVYTTPETPGFAAVVKARYSDFIVREVSIDKKEIASIFN